MPPRDKVLFQVSADNAAGRRRCSASVRGSDGEVNVTTKVMPMVMILVIIRLVVMRIMTRLV